MKPLRIAQISDFHLTEVTYNPFRLCSKRLIGILNWLFSRKSSYSKEQVYALSPLLKSLKVDHILLGGDFTTTALPSEYKLAVDFVETLPAPWIAIPGNHDHYTLRAYYQKHFYKYLTNHREINHKTGFFNLAEQGVEAHRLEASNWWVVALDTAQATLTHSARGLFKETTEKNLKELLSLIPSDHSILLFNHYPFFQNDLHRRTLERGKDLEKIVTEDTRIKAYLHGHTHRHIIANLQPSGLPVVLDSGCCTDSKKGSWNLLTIDDHGIQIDAYFWKNGWTISRTENFAWTR